MNRLYASLVAALAIAGLLWWYGAARYDAGYAAAAAEQAQEVSQIEREMDALRREADGRLAAKETELTKKEEDYREKLSRLKSADGTFRAWLEMPVHPAAVDLIRGLRDEAGGGALRPGPDTGAGATAPPAATAGEQPGLARLYAGHGP